MNPRSMSVFASVKRGIWTDGRIGIIAVGQLSTFERRNDFCFAEATSGERREMGEQVAQGQYVVSDTRCPALPDCELE